jgi:FkbM family methyltransferase
MAYPDRPAVTAALINLLARRTPLLETELHTLGGLVGPGSVCVDVGAAAGVYTVALSRLVGAAGQVHSVEPLSFAHPTWSRVLGACRIGNVVHHAVALGAEAGRATMSVPISRHGPVTGRSFLAWQTNGLGSNAEFADHVDIVVEVRTLDVLCADLNRLDFVKIDVEGAELHVLRGAHRIVETFRPTMLIEIEQRHTTRYRHAADDVVDWLVQRGYTMHTWQRGWQQTTGVCERNRNYLFRPSAAVAQPAESRSRARRIRSS